MERGPMALFGAIIAIGLGPAMWLGAQFGSAASSPGTSPTVIVQQDAAKGGVGGAAPNDPGTVKTDPKSNDEPLTAVPPKAHEVKTSPSPSTSPTPTASPSTSPTPGDDDSSTPTTGTTTSSAPPSDDDGDGDGGSGGGGDGHSQVPPAPPTTDASTPDSSYSAETEAAPAV